MTIAEREQQILRVREQGFYTEREWQVLQRYQRSLGNLLDWMCCLYVMELSLRDLQLRTVAVEQFYVERLPKVGGYMYKGVATKT
jgi:hypothetical protein